MEVEHLLPIQNKLGEGPLWSPEERSLYWVDIEQNRFHRLKPETGEVETHEVGMPVSVLGLREKGGLILAAQNVFSLWQPGSANFQPLQDVEIDEPGARLNDGAVDPQGCFWAGVMSPAGRGKLFRVSAEGETSVMEAGLGVSNGIGWSPDHKKMYLTDSGPGVIYVYDYDPGNGEIRNRRLFVDAVSGEGVPDGLTVDAEGFIWSARWGGWKIVRYTPQGKVDREVRMPVEFPTSCAFGGPELDELYITSAWTAVKAENKKDQPLAGDLFRIYPGVKGSRPNRFKG